MGLSTFLGCLRNCGWWREIRKTGIKSVQSWKLNQDQVNIGKMMALVFRAESAGWSHFFSTAFILLAHTTQGEFIFASRLSILLCVLDFCWFFSFGIKEQLNSFFWAKLINNLWYYARKSGIFHNWYKTYRNGAKFCEMVQNPDFGLENYWRKKVFLL